MENTKAYGIETRKKIKQFIIQYMQEHGYSPTTREIGDAFVKLEEVERCSKPLPTKDGYMQMVYRD